MLEDLLLERQELPLDGVSFHITGSEDCPSKLVIHEQGLLTFDRESPDHTASELLCAGLLETLKKWS